MMDKDEEIKYSIQCPRCMQVMTYLDGVTFVECDCCQDKIFIGAAAEKVDPIVSMISHGDTVYVATATRVYRLVSGMGTAEAFVPVRFSHEL